MIMEVKTQTNARKLAYTSTHTHTYFFLNEKYKFYSQIVYLIKDIPKSTQRGTLIYPSKHTQMHVNEDGRLD